MTVGDVRDLAYILAAVLFIFGLKMLSSQTSARRGNLVSSLGMLVAVVATLCAGGLAFHWILLGLVIGSVIGVVAALRVQMTGMPEMVALLNGFGGLASLLVGWAEYLRKPSAGTFMLGAIVATVLIGSVTFTGSVVAYAKLAGRISSKPVLFRGQKLLNGLFLAICLAVGAAFAVRFGGISPNLAFGIVLAIAAVLGVTAVIPIGGADMPVVIALLNSYSGLAACAAGFVISNTVLIVSGSLVGASGIVLTSSWGANGLPVAEYTLSQILFSLKLGWRYVTSIQRDGRYPRKGSVPGGYGSTVAIISLGMIGRLVANLLKSFDLKVIAYDPFVGADDAASLGVHLCSLDECFTRADVVSLHTPWLAETVGMITAAHFRLMKPDASFINTSRGAVVDEPGMISVLEERPDVTAVLDVTYPEPPVQGSKLYALPNVILTPHIAGSMGNECRRMGRYAVEECSRYLRGDPLQWQVTREKAATLA